jgi:20S proteasome alpha/beta subunit
VSAAPSHCLRLPFIETENRFLAYVDLLGVTYSASTLATGYGAYIALPLLRKAVEGRENTLTEPEARAILEDALRVLFYRDARSINQVPCLPSSMVTIVNFATR